MFVIRYNILVNGKTKKLYHSDIDKTPHRSGAVNIYRQHLSPRKKEATKFYDDKEAERVTLLFPAHFGTVEVLQVN